MGSTLLCFYFCFIIVVVIVVVYVVFYILDLEASVSMTVTNIWDDDDVEDIWDVLEDGIEQILEGNDAYDSSQTAYYMVEWDATQDSDRRRRGRRLLLTTTTMIAADTTTSATEAPDDSVESTSTATEVASGETTETGSEETDGTTNEPSESEDNSTTESDSEEESDTTNEPSDSNSGDTATSVTFVFTVRVYAGDDSSTIETLYDYLIGLGATFASDYESNVEALALLIDEDGFGDITINSASLALYDNQGNEVEGTETIEPSGSSGAISNKQQCNVLWLSIVFVVTVAIAGFAVN